MTDTRMRMAWQRALARTAVAAAVFALLLGGVLIAHAVRVHAANPFTAPALKTLKTQITQQGNKKLVAAYQQMDAAYQARYFAGRAAVERGLPLLAGSIALCLLAGMAGALLRRGATDPRELTAAQPARGALAGRYGVATFGLLLAGTLVGLAAIPPPMVPSDAGIVATVVTPDAPGAVAPPDGPAFDELMPDDINLVIVPPEDKPPAQQLTAHVYGGSVVMPDNQTAPATGTTFKPTGVTDALSHLPNEQTRNWPCFRGPGSLGLTAATDTPLQWDVKTGKHILWKAEVPLTGHNSPIVWDDHVFLSGSDGKTQEVYCYDASTGALRWRGSMAGITGSEEAEGHGDTGHAAPTMATDGSHAFALFANGDLAAFDFAGKRLWAKNIGPFESQYGFATSLITYRNLLILQLDQGSGADEGLSELLALHADTGKQAWRVKGRPVPNSWSSPAIIPTATRDELITCGKPWTIAYDPANGTELWRADCLGGDVASTPAYGNGLLLVCNPYQAIIALRPGGSGDVTKRAVAWTAEGNAPDTTSPAANDEIYVYTSTTTLTCGDVKSGKTLWEYDLGANAYASPIIAAGRIYLLDMDGTMHILAAAKTQKVLGTVKMGENATATPAFVGNRIFIRTGTRLYCVGGGQ